MEVSNKKKKVWHLLFHCIICDAMFRPSAHWVPFTQWMKVVTFDTIENAKIGMQLCESELGLKVSIFDLHELVRP